MSATRWFSIGVAVALAGCGSSDAMGPGDEAGSLAVLTAEDAVHDVRDLRATDGAIWVVSRFEPFVNRFSSDGRLELAFGRGGRGPGEFLNAWSLVDVDSLSVRVFDIGTNRVLTFDHEGEFVRATSLEVSPTMIVADIREISYGFPRRVRAVAGHYLVDGYGSTLATSRQFQGSVVTRLNERGEVLDTLIRFGDAASTSEERRLLPIPLWDTCSSTAIARFDPASREITVEELASGDTHSWIPEIETPLLREAAIRRHLEYMVARELHEHGMDGDVVQLARRFAAERRSEFPRREPGVVSLLCDGTGEVWLQTFSLQDHPLGLGRRWMRYRADGTRYGVTFPAGFQPVQISGTRIYGVLVDSLDVQRVAVVEAP